MCCLSECSRQPALLLTLTIFVLSGCATAPAPVTEIPAEESAAAAGMPDALPPPEEEARTFALPDEVPADGVEAPGDAGTAAPSPAPEPINSPAVVALIDEAARQAHSGDAEQAAATLERALRIEPRNPWLWHRLAVLRMQQGFYEQAIELALRSNFYANGDERLLSGNQQVIEQCRAALDATRRT